MLPDDSPALQQAQARMASRAVPLQDRGLAFRPPPPVPTTCCGRGCNGCVWEGWFAAVDWWCEEADGLLAGAGRPGGVRN